MFLPFLIVCSYRLMITHPIENGVDFWFCVPKDLCTSDELNFDFKLMKICSRKNFAYFALNKFIAEDVSSI
jgi:hypothetical protein